jgi:3-hydroxyacyl-CoA dehydrogenase/enoyl-CoA hydratase/3-hydroxybutyryl-CoA epimerase
MAGEGHEEGLALEVDSDSVGWLTFDRPGSKVNLLTTPVMERLDAVITELQSRIATGKLVAIVVWSGKPGTFIAGADVNEIAMLVDADDARAKSRKGQRVLSRISRLTVPTIAAVDGVCLGGGTELALACDYRLASDRASTRLGLPETQLGILPGFGGTVRLPRQCGIQNAMNLILTGAPVRPEKALRLALVDRVLPADGFRDAVRRFVREIITGQVTPTSYRKSLRERLLEDTGPGRKLLFSMARSRTVRRTRGRYPAPMVALDVIEQTRGLPVDEALEIESRALGELAVTPVSKNLIRIFLLSQGARDALPPATRDRRRPVRKVGVLGAGVMGGAIAELAASRDVDVVLKDIEQGPLDAGLRHAHDLLQKAARKGVFSAEQAGLKFARIQGVLEYEGFEGVDLAIEAVVERMAVKKQVLREAEEVLPAEAVFATNTSSLSVAELASAASRPERVVGLHFFNPVHRMPLVEVIRTASTSEEALATAFGFALDMDKKPVIVRDSPGFLVNRLLGPYLNEAGHLLEEGAPVHRIDEAIVEFGMPMGPCRLLDEVGFDVAQHVATELSGKLGDRLAPSGVIDRLIEDGRLGKKNGLGFYIYQDGREKGVDSDLRRALPKPAGAAPDDDEIRRRCLYAMVNEAAFALEEEIVADASAVDLAMVMGTGFPPFRGGLLRWADGEGLATIVESLRELATRVGPRFEPAALLVDMAGRGETFTTPVTV